MKATLQASVLTITLLFAGATAMAHDRFPDSGSSYRGRGCEDSRYEDSEVLYDRFGNTVVVRRSQRYVAPAPERYYRAPVVVQEYHRSPVCEDRSRTSFRFEPPFFSPLRFLFRH